jgi:hypothetical protein
MAEQGRLRWEAAAIVVLAAASAISPPPLTDADTLSRLAVARSFVEHGVSPRSDPFTIDAGLGAPHHSEWLGDLGWLGLFRLDGVRGLQLGRLVLVCAALLLTLRLCHTLGASPTVAALLLLALLPIAASRFTERNDLHAYWLVPLFGVVLEAALQRPRLWPVLLPFGWLWAQLHASFILGPAIVLLSLARARALRARVPWRVALPVLFLLPLMPALGPGGLGPYRQLLDHVAHAPLYRGLLIEWSPATASAATLALLPLHGAALALIAFHPARLARGLAPIWALAVLAVAGAYLSRRFLPLAALLATPVLAIALTRSLERLRPVRRRALAIVAGSAVLLFTGTAISVHRARRPASVLHSPAVLPVRFLVENAPPASRVFNDYNLGPFLLWFGEGRLRHFADPRNSAGAGALAEYVRLLEDPARFAREAEARGIAFALLALDDQRQAGLVDRLGASPHWTRVYRDGAHVIFARGSSRASSAVAR